jgi:hypothetical protein
MHLRLFTLLALAPTLCAQMNMSHMNMNRAGMYLMNMASGTAMNPYSWQMPMRMTEAGTWNLMFMSQAYIVDTQQSGPRGADKFYSPNWFMASAMHSLAGGSLMLTSMISLEPATITNRSYPLLFQTGETAFGRPLIDRQHPHDFLMALSVDYARPFDRDTMLQFFYAAVGDPALGPVAFPHRASAAELPQAPLGHHWQDSSHIANNVATVAVRHKWLRVEASGFYGTEPNENRWNVDWGPMNSWSARISAAPTQNWMAQVSAGRLTRPERQEEGDVIRTTASLAYSRPMDGGNSWSSSLIWGRNHETFTHRDVDSYLIETVYPASRRNFLTGRVEVVDKDELALPPQAGTVFRIRAYTAGYTRDIGTFGGIETGIGANVTTYGIPDVIKPYYGDRPWGVNFYLRFRLR